MLNRFCVTVFALTIFTCIAFAQGTSEKVIYGPDDRLDVFEVTDEMLLSLSNSTCILVSSGRVTPAENNTFEAVLSPYTISGLNPCEDEPFGNQPVFGFCTGFLVRENLIATAGHCFGSGVENTKFVFGYDMLDASTVVGTFDESQVYTGVEVVGRVLAGREDWMLVRVDRFVTAPGAIPLPIRRVGDVPTATPVGVIGHPSGLPKKIAFGATTETKGVDSLIFFEANVDTYGGNSGSPIFNQNTLEVEGILVRGETDFVNGGGCFRSNMYTDETGNPTPGDDGPYESCTRIGLLANLIPVDPLEPPAGDVDGNGTVNSSDIQNVINEVLGGMTGFPTDLNNDLVTNSVDIQMVINFVLGI